MNLVLFPYPSVILSETLDGLDQFFSWPLIFLFVFSVFHTFGLVSRLVLVDVGLVCPLPLPLPKATRIMHTLLLLQWHMSTAHCIAATLGHS